MDALLVSWNGGGAVPPMLGLGAELRRRGHNVRWLGPTGQRSVVELLDLEFRPVDEQQSFENTVQLSAQEQQALVADLVYGAGYAQNFRSEVARSRPDVAVIDATLYAAQAAAESLSIPRAVLVHTIASQFLAVRARGLDRIN